MRRKRRKEGEGRAEKKEERRRIVDYVRMVCVV